jgi:hypothetical protein
MIFMWTAVGAQEEQRTLHAKDTASGDTRSGWGYFGFGPKLADFRTGVKAGTVATTQQSIEKMICNWAGPNNRILADQPFRRRRQNQFAVSQEPPTGYVPFRT